MSSLYVFADSRFGDRVKFGRCAANNPAEYLKTAWCYTPGTVGIVACWVGEETAVKAAEKRLSAAFAGREVARRFPSAGREVVFLDVDRAAERIEEILGDSGLGLQRGPVADWPLASARPSSDNLRNPTTRGLERGDGLRFKQVVWVYREQDDAASEPARVKTSRINDWRTPRELHKRYSFAGLEALAGFTYSLDGPVSAEGNRRVEAAVQVALVQFGDPGPARIHGWTAPGTVAAELEELYEREFGLVRVDPAVMPAGVKPAYNLAA